MSKRSHNSAHSRADTAVRKTVAVAQWILILTTGIALVVTRYSGSPAVSGKIVLYQGAAAILAAISAYLFFVARDSSAVLDRAIRVFKQPIFLALTASIFLLALSTIFAFEPSVALFGDINRGEGFVVLFALYVLYAAIAIFFDRASWTRFFIAIGGTTIVMSVIGLGQYLGGAGRPSGTIGNPIFLSAWYLFSLFAGYYLLCGRDGAHKRLAPIGGGIVMVLSALGIVLSNTRGTVVGIAIATLVTMIVVWATQKGVSIGRYSVRSLIGWIMGVLVAIGILFVATHTARIWQRIPVFDRIATFDTTTLTSRVIYTQIAVQGFTESTPLQKVLGWGWDNIWFFGQRYYDPAVYYYDPGFIDRTHNKITDTLIMTGVLGLLAYLVLWGAIVARVRRLILERNILGYGALFVGVSYFVHNLFAFDTPAVLYAFYVLLAFLTSYDYDHK